MIRSWLAVGAALVAGELCANLHAEKPGAIATGWKLLASKGGVALYRRQRPASNESRAIGEIAASTGLIHAVLDDLESYASFMPYTTACLGFKREGNSVLAYQRIPTLLPSHRHHNVRARSTSNAV